jgi:hypothetical protein
MAMHLEKRQVEAEDHAHAWLASNPSFYIGVGAFVVIVGVSAYWLKTHRPARGPTRAAPLPQVATATLISTDGTVRVKPHETLAWVPAENGMLLSKGDEIWTGSRTAAEIRVVDGTTLQLRPDSLMTIEGIEDPATKAHRPLLRINSGKVTFRSVQIQSFSTPTAKERAAAETEGGVAVADTGETVLDIFKGSAEVETSIGERIHLGANEGVRVDPKGKGRPKVQLLQAPQPVNPPNLAAIAYPDPSRAATLLAWRPVPQAASYHVVLDVRAHFSGPLVDRRGIKEGTLELRGLEPGVYYWRVAAVDQGGNEGDFSGAYQFTIGPGNTAPPPLLVVEPVDVRSNIVYVKGRTQPSASVTVNGQRVDVREDGSFDEHMTLEGQFVVIRSTSAEGGVSEQTQVLPKGKNYPW